MKKPTKKELHKALIDVLIEFHCSVKDPYSYVVIGETNMLLTGDQMESPEEVQQGIYERNKGKK